jgi:hypothetical protein
LVAAGLILLLLLAAIFRRGERDGVTNLSHSEATSDTVKGEIPTASRVADSPSAALTNNTKPLLISDQQIEKWIQGLFSKHVKARSAHSDVRLSGFGTAKYLHYREARLAANAYPEVTARLALAVALDTSADWVERAYTVSMLQNLSKSGSSSCSAALQSMANDLDPRVADLALAALASADSEGLARGLYWDRCKKGSVTGYRIVSHYADSETASLLREILATGRSFYAEEALERVQVLQSADWEQKLGAILKPARSNETDTRAAQWALDMVERKRTPYLLQVLRSRLDHGLANALTTWKSGSLGVATSTFDNEMKCSPDIIDLTKDPIYDESLVVYGQSGGTLSELERGRLREFGFLCDPKQRLRELMGEEQ